ncbi:hypothetical protein ABV23_RS02360 [Escherichia coli]|nr:hypothetical protein [Escherichia coli]
MIEDSKNLISVSLNKRTIRTSVRDVNTLYVSFNPPDYINQVGTWTYDEQYIEMITQDNLVFVFKSIKSGVTTITYTPRDNKALSKNCIVNIEKIPLSSISLNPNYITLYKGQTFDIDISYIPDGAVHSGNWSNLNNDILYIGQQSTPDKSRMQVLTTDAKMITLYYTSGEISVPLNCTILNNPADEIIFDPPSPINVTVGESFFVNINYAPENADKVGFWEYDDSVLMLLNDSDKASSAHFVATKKTTSTGTELKFRSGDVYSTLQCFITPGVLDLLTLTPSYETVVVGDAFDIGITYYPEDIIHKGIWEYDSTYFKKMFDDSNTATFRLIKKSDIPLKLRYISYGRAFNNICTTVENGDLVSLQLNPNSESVEVGKSFDIAITYKPDNALHSGIWDFDSEYIKLEKSSTVDKATFTVLKYNPNPLTLTYKSGKTTATNKCITVKNTPVLSSIKVSPESTEMKVGDTVLLSISYNPNTVEHMGMWYYDKKLFKLIDTGQTHDYGIFECLAVSDAKSPIVFSSAGNADACIVTTKEKTTKED